MREIPATRGIAALVDDADYEELSKYKWWTGADGYICRWPEGSGTGKGKRPLIRMHRVVMGLAHGDPLKVDHIDGNKANNQRSNLRVCTHAQNLWNKPKSKKNTSGFKGVQKMKDCKNWRAIIRANGKTIHIGMFPTPEEAYAAYCKKAREIHGEFANVD